MKIAETEFDEAYFCPPDLSIPEVAKILQENFIRAVCIEDKEMVIGMVSDQMILKNLMEGKDLLKLTARDLMREDCPNLDKNIQIEEAYKESKKNPCRVFLVTDEGKVIGQISKKRIEFHYFEIEKTSIYNVKKRIPSIRL